MNKPLSNYKAYTLADFINDEDFLLWVLKPDKVLDNYWQNILKAYPQLNPIAIDAKEIVLSMRFETETFSEAEQQQLWTEIEAKTTLIKLPVKTQKLWYKYVAAAAIAGILFCVGLLYSVNQKTTIDTPYGQLKNITLPDGSEVTLNANSKIKYSNNWDKDVKREIWVEGEAFLKVKHLHKTGEIKNQERFVVHTGAVDVEVLGTSFNVNDRRGRTEIALLDGKISLSTENNNSLVLAPGDIAEYENGKLIKKAINVAEYSSWKEGKLHFKNVSLSTIFNYIEDIYGYKVVVKDPKILEKRLTGAISTKDKAVFFKAIGVTLNIDITPKKETNELIVNSK